MTDFPEIDRIAKIVARSIFDERNEPFTWSDRIGRKLIDQTTNRRGRLDVGPLAVASDIVALSVPPFFRD